MKLDFRGRNMDVATYPFRFMRILGIAGTGGCEPYECFLTLEKIRDHDDESWVQEWAKLAARTERLAERAMTGGQTVLARGLPARFCLLPGGDVFAIAGGPAAL